MTDLQRSYLRQVSRGLTSKEIAQAVGGSHNTINVEIGIAMRVLGAKSRHEAAAILSDAEQPASYQPSYEAPDIEDARPDGEGRGDDEDESTTHWALPVPTEGRPVNMLTGWQRVGWILVLAATIALLLGGLASGVTALLVGLARWF